MTYPRYNQGQRGQTQAQAQAYINYTSKLPSGDKVKMDSKKLFSRIPSHEQAIEVCRQNHDQTFEDKFGITHYWFVKPVDPTVPVCTSWSEDTVADAPAVSASSEEDVLEAVAEAVAADESEDDIPF